MTRKESNLRGHLDEKSLILKKLTNEDSSTENTLKDDYQLNRAIDLIKSISVYETLKKAS